jgi:DNA-binding transcriptional LysR family regulator
MVQAAQQGLGMALLYAPPRKPFQMDERLVTLSKEPLPAPFAMFFVCRQHEAERSELIALREWLTECIAG